MGLSLNPAGRFLRVGLDVLVVDKLEVAVVEGELVSVEDPVDVSVVVSVVETVDVGVDVVMLNGRRRQCRRGC